MSLRAVPLDAPRPRSRRNSLLVLVAIVILFGLGQIFISWHRLVTLQADAMDLGYFEQVLWKISHGDWWAYSTVFHTPALAADGCVWLYPLAYAFRYLGGPMVLFVVQALGTGLAAIGLYRAAMLRGMTPWVAVTLGVAFLLYPAILGGSQFDFHPDFIALPAVIWAYVADAEGNPRRYYACLAVAALAKNVVLVSLVGWGIGLIVWRHRIRDGLIVMGASLALLGAELLWIIPTYFAHGTEAINLSLYGYLGSSFVGVVVGLITRFPALIAHLATEPAYVVWIFGPVLGLVFAGSASVPAFLALWLMNAVSMFAPQQQVNDQYQVVLAGWLFLALVEALARWPQRQKFWVVTVALSTAAFEGLLIALYIAPLFAPPFGLASAPRTPARAAARHIPANSAVWTESRLGPVIYRHRVWGVDRGGVPGIMVDSLPTLWQDARTRGLSTTVLFAERPTSPYLASVLTSAMAAGYRLIYHHDGFFLVQGTRHFEVAPPASIGFQPRTAEWILPAWTQASPVGQVDWRGAHSVVIARWHHPGTVLGPIVVVLRPGRYQVLLHIAPPSGVPGRVLGTLSDGRIRQRIHAGERVVTLTVTCHHLTVAQLTVSTTGVARFALEQINVTRVGPAQ